MTAAERRLLVTLATAAVDVLAVVADVLNALGSSRRADLCRLAVRRLVSAQGAVRLEGGGQ